MASLHDNILSYGEQRQQWWWPINTFFNNLMNGSGFIICIQTSIQQGAHHFVSCSLHFQDIFLIGQCVTNNDFLFPFMSTFFGLLSLGDCLLKSNLGIFQANFLHACIKLNFIGSILTCFWHNVIKTKTTQWLR